MGYQETSAKTGENVEKSFSLVIDSNFLLKLLNSLLNFIEIYDELKETIIEPPK
jgi:hypothetical protein